MKHLLREIKQLAQGHPAGTRHSQELNLVAADSKTFALSTPFNSGRSALDGHSFCFSKHGLYIKQKDANTQVAQPPLSTEETNIASLCIPH